MTPGLDTLPGELRNLIYHYALAGDAPSTALLPLIHVPARAATNPGSIQHGNNTFALAQVCKVLRADYLPLYLRKVRGRVKIRWRTLAAWLSAFYPTPESYVNAPEHLLISLEGRLFETFQINVLPLIAMKQACPTVRYGFQQSAARRLVPVYTYVPWPRYVPPVYAVYLPFLPLHSTRRGPTDTQFKLRTLLTFLGFKGPRFLKDVSDGRISRVLVQQQVQEIHILFKRGRKPGYLDDVLESERGWVYLQESKLGDIWGAWRFKVGVETVGNLKMKWERAYDRALDRFADKVFPEFGEYTRSRQRVLEWPG